MRSDTVRKKSYKISIKIQGKQKKKNKEKKRNFEEAGGVWVNLGEPVNILEAIEFGLPTTI